MREVLVHTGQHFDDSMSQVFFDELDLRRPDHNLGIAGGPHGEQTGRMMIALEPVVIREAPDRILIYGDTNSTLAGALVGAKLHISLAHVEAGLRSFNREMPEEINRVVADHLADTLFAPTSTAVKNLAHEGVPSDRIYEVGDVMFDAALYYAGRASDDRLAQFALRAGDFALATIHRAENTDDPARLCAIVDALAMFARDHVVALPLHPRTRQALARLGVDPPATSGLRILPPVGYLDMIALERGATLIITDSGGVQKEAFFHRVPCVTLRDETEWVELVEIGWNRLASPTDSGTMVRAFHSALASQPEEARAEGLYGHGDAGLRIVDRLASAERESSAPPS